MKALGTALAVVVLLGSTAAFADDEGGGGESVVRKPGGLFDTSASHNQQMLSGFVFVPYYYGFGIGVGARYTIPIVEKGWISQLNDSVELEFGADGWFDSYGYLGYNYGFFAIGVPIEGRWTFHITDKFSAYAKVGAGLAFYFGSCGNVSCGYSLVNFYPEAGPGVLYKLGDKMWLRGEIGYQGAKIGLGFSM